MAHQVASLDNVRFPLSIMPLHAARHRWSFSGLEHTHQFAQKEGTTRVDSFVEDYTGGHLHAVAVAEHDRRWGQLELASDRRQGTQLNRLFRTGFYAQATGVTGLGAHRERLPVAMGPGFQPAAQRQRCALLRGKRADLEYIIGTDLDTGSLGLATVAIDDGGQFPRSRVAVGMNRWSAHGLRCQKPSVAGQG